MSKQDILAGFDSFSDHLLLALAESDHLKKQVKELMEDNARLRLENQQLQALLSQLQNKESEEVLTSGHGRGHLEAIYEEGFHVCNSFYGQSRDNAEACAFCMELLYRD